MTSTLTIGESAFQDAVIEYAERNGWLIAHFADSRREIVKADGESQLVGDARAAGFPDLVLVRDDVLIFAELKSAKGRVSAKQKVWLEALAQVDEAVELASGSAHVRAFLWRPGDWPTIEQALKRRFT